MLAIAGLLVLSYFPLSRIRAANAGATILPSAGKPLVNLKAAQNLKLTYTGSADAVAALKGGTAIPTALASADFNADGAMDVVAGYSGNGGGFLVLMRGNPDAFAPTDLTLYGKAAKGNVPPTFLSKAAVFTVPESPDLIATGDFNRDGYKDVLVASRGGSLYLLAGDGHGNLLAAKAVPVLGQVRALDVTPDGHVALSLDAPNGSQLAILAPGKEGLTTVATYPLPARGDSVAWGSLGGGADVAVGAGSNVVMIYSALTANAQTETVSVPFKVQGLALGDFIWDRDGRTEIAVLADDGSIHILQHGTLNTTPVTAAELPARQAAIRGHHTQAATRPNPTALGAWTIAKQIPYTGSAPSGPVSASAFSSPRLASSSTPDLMVLDAAAGRLHILDTSGTTASPSADVSFSGTPVAALALPEKINSGRDIVVLTSSQSAPTLIPAGGDPTFTVSTTADEDDAGACTSTSVTSGNGTDGVLSLREAICEANNNAPLTSTVNVGPGTYSLTSLETGEIQIGNASHGYTLTINGTGTPANTIIQQTDGVDRIFEEDFHLFGNNPVTIQNVTMTGGHCTISSPNDCNVAGGGAIVAGGVTGDDLTVTNAVLNNNAADPTETTMNQENAGAIAFETPADITITNSTFSSNTASGAGGAIYFLANGTGNMSVTGSTFSSNKAEIFGGGIGVTLDPGITFTVSGSTFTGNTVTDAAGTGGGIFAETFGTVTVSNSRFVGNVAPNGGTGASIEASSTGTLTDNWWGCNAGPGNSGCDSVFAGGGGTATFNPWLKLSLTANPTQIGTGGTSTLTADLTHDSDGNGGFSVPNGTPVKFSTDGTLGSVSPTSTTTGPPASAGQATSTYTAGATPGSDSSPAAKVDSQTVNTSITIVAPVLSVSKTHVGTFTQGSTAQWDVTVSNTATGSTTSGTTNVQDTLPTGYTISSFGSTSGWSCSGTGTANCTSTQAVAGGNAFSTIQIIVNVPSNSPTSVSNTALAWGGGDLTHTSSATAATGSDNNVPVVQVPASITINGMATQSANVLTAFGSLAVTVLDAGGVAIPNYSSVTFTAPATGPSGTFSNSTGTMSTNGSGIADPGTFTANALPGSYTVGVAAGSATATFNLTNMAVIVAASTSTSISSNNNPSFTAAPGNSVTFTATVTSNTTVNEGTVTFSDPANDFTCSGGNTVPVSNGTATCTTSFSTEGSRNVTAAYNGTVNFQASSGFVTQTVNNHTVVTGNQFCNPGAITVPSTAGAATPYPSNIFVTGLGNIGAVTVTLNDISSSDIAQTDLLLVGPTGAAIVPFAAVGDGSTISGVKVTLDDAAASLIPGGSPLVSGSFKPTSITGSTNLVFPAPAPTITTPNYAATDGSATLTSTFQGTAANGTWALYAMDNAGSGAATIGGGWCLNITPAVTATSIAVTNVSPSSEVYGLDSTVTITAVLSWTGTGPSPTASDVTIGGNGPSGYSSTTCGTPVSDTLTCTATYTPTGADTVGSYTESAIFSGDSNYSGSSSTQTNNFSITQATSSTSVGSSQNPSVVGQSVTFTATIDAQFGLIVRQGAALSSGATKRSLQSLIQKGSAHPLVAAVLSGTVTWSANTGCGSTPVSGDPGTSQCTTSTLPQGTDTITAIYSGDSNHSGSTGTLSGGQVVNGVPMVKLNPTSVSFGDIRLFSIHAKNVTVTNTGTVSLLISKISLTEAGGNPDGFHFVKFCGSTLAPGKSCAITIVPLTEKIGSNSATLNIADNAAGSPQQVPISDTVINPRAELSPQSLNFGTHKVGSSTTKNVTLTNDGTAALDIISIAITGADQGDFSQTNACPSSLNPGDHCTISVTFTPEATGARKAGLTVTDNSFVGKETVSLSGTGD